MIHTTPEELIYLSLQRSVIGLLKESAVVSFQDEVGKRMDSSNAFECDL